MRQVARFVVRVTVDTVALKLLHEAEGRALGAIRRRWAARKARQGDWGPNGPWA